MVFHAPFREIVKRPFGGDNIFSLHSVGELAVWIDFSDITTMFTDNGTTQVTTDGNAIYRINDKSGKNNHAIQTNATYRPAYKTGIQNGNSAGGWAGTNKSLIIADSNTFKTSIINAFVVGKDSARNAYAWFVGYPHAATHTSPYFRWNIGYWANQTEAGSYINGVRNTTLYNDDGFSRANTNIIYSSIDLGDIYMNNALLKNGNGSALSYPNNVGLRIGSNANSAEAVTGYIMEILVYTSSIDEGGRENVHSYLNEKWAVY